MRAGKPIISLTLLLGFSLPASSPVLAEKVITLTDCEKSPFSGTWVSSTPDVPFLSKLEIREECKQIISKPALAAKNPWAGSLGRERRYIHRAYTLHPTSTCAPVDCKWGRARGDMSKNGMLRAQFSLFWSKRILELRRENQNLRVHWRLKYVGQKKPDKTGETLLVRVK